MKRRDFLKITASIPFIGSPAQETLHGWRPGQYSKRSSFRSVTPHLRFFGKAKVALLYKPWEAITGRSWLAHSQKGPDCTAHSTGGALDLLTAIQIRWREQKEQWITKSSTDAIYSGARIVMHNDYGRGLSGEKAIEYLTKYGNLLRQPYPPYDLTPYNVKYWSKTRLPDALLEIAKEHPLLESNPVLSWPELRDAVSAGFPVVFCASLGADNSKRDSEGFLRPRGRWNHAWLCAGVDDKYKRPGALLINSHSPYWASGPKRHEQPDGSVWVDADVIDYHCRKYGDSHALNTVKGYPKPEEDYILW